MALSFFRELKHQHFDIIGRCDRIVRENLNELIESMRKKHKGCTTIGTSFVLFLYHKKTPLNKRRSSLWQKTILYLD